MHLQGEEAMILKNSSIDRSMAFSNLPENVVTEILKRFPVKCLLRFRSLCKLWIALIQNPNFVSQHASSSTKKHQNPSSCAMAMIGRSSGISLEIIWSEGSVLIHLAGVKFHGHCNGNICASLLGTKLRACFLWNPVTKEFKNLPASCIDTLISIFIMGSGFDPNSNEYRVVRLGLTPRVVQPQKPFLERNPTSEEGAGGDGVSVGKAMHCDMWVNGVFWHMSNPGLLLFDLGDEVFKVIDTPAGVSHLFNVKFNRSSIVALSKENEGRIDVSVMADVELEIVQFG